MGENRRSQIKMTADEVDKFLHEGRTATMCSMHPDGSIQKVANLRRDPRLTVLVEAGETYDQLRGVELVGRARVIEDADTIWKLGISVWERYVGPYDESQREGLAMMLNNRVLVTIDVDKTVSWDHRKLAAG
jgi:hypothetical protein